MDSAETGKEPTEILANTEIPEQFINAYIHCIREEKHLTNRDGGKFDRMLAVAPGLDDQRRVGRQPVSAASLAVTHCRSPSEGEGDGEMFSGDTAYGNQRDVEE
ncbi:hypothetical protein OsI_07309 [Oryza sativa Indica Group]|nr:hypothetical protein OsI_07309 [Oryza sativa Indica Group]